MRPGKLTCTSQGGLTQEVTSVNDNGVAMAVSPSTLSIWVVSGYHLLNCFAWKAGDDEHSHANFPKPEGLCQKYAENYARQNSETFSADVDPSGLADGEGRYLKSCEVSEDKEWVAPADCNEQHQKGKDRREEGEIEETKASRKREGKREDKRGSQESKNRAGSRGRPSRSRK